MHSDTSSEPGYTLLEALVTLFIIAEILVAVLVLFDFNSRVGRTQSQVAELQQSHRVAQGTLVRLLRSAGRGPVGRGDLPVGAPGTMPVRPAFEVWNNVAAGREIAPGFAGGPVVQAGTDILVIRGVISNPMFLPPLAIADTQGNLFVETAPDDWIPGFMLRPFAALGLPDESPILQPPDAVLEAIQEGRPETFIAASAEDSSRTALFQLNPAESAVISLDPVNIRVALNGADPLYAGAGPPAITNALHIGILEEYRIYVRPPEGGLVVGAANAGRDSPRLAMARVYPFTNLPHAGDPANLSIELAENIFDLQIAMGIDLDMDGQIDDNANLGLDEWMLNDPRDLINPPVVGGRDWNTALSPPLPPNSRRAPLLFVRVSTLAMTDRPDSSYEAPLMAGLEDHPYLTAGFSTDDLINEPFQRKFRRRALTTLVDLRSVQ